MERPNDRLIKLKLIIGGEVYNIISAYAPQTGCKEEVKEEFYEGFKQLIVATKLDEIILVGGDMNGHVGTEAVGFPEVHGGMGYGTRNEDGERLLEYCESLELALTNTYFTKKDEHKITYKSGNHMSQIDFMLVRRRDLGRVLDCRVVPGEAVVTQHRLVCMRFKTGRVKPRRPIVKERIKTWVLRKEGKKVEYQNKARDDYARQDGSVNEKWNNIKCTLMQAAEEVCGKTKGGRMGERKETWWWNEEVQEKIKAKKAAFKEWQRTREESKKEEYKVRKGEAKRAVAKARAESLNAIYDTLDENQGCNIYRIARQRAATRKDVTSMPFIKDQAGEILSETEEIKMRWKEYFNNLLNEENEREEMEEVIPVEGPIPIVTRLEVAEALKKMKKGKAAGCSGFEVDLVKVLDELGVDMVLDLLESIWEHEEMPSEWEESETVPIYKQKGDPLDCGNFRGIKLLEHLLKVLERILDQRLRELVEINDMQFGFSKGKGTSDAVFVVQQLQEKFREKKRDLLFTFVDLEKAYDRIPRELVYWCLRKRGVPEAMVRLVQTTYKDVKTRVRTAVGTTESFGIEVGLHQGSALSPFLFVLVLDTISSSFRRSVPWEVLFADDLVVAAETEEQLQEIWLKWQKGLARHGLKVNTGKTEVMSSSPEPVVMNILDRDGVVLKQVKIFKYLGFTLSEKGGSQEAVKARISAAWMKWKEFTGIIYDKRMPRRMKVKIYKTVIRPVIMYGAEMWVLRKKEERMLETTEMKMLRRIRGVTRLDRLRNDDIRQELGVENIITKVRQSRLRWYGHLLRMEEGNAVKKMWETEIDGRRPRGRPLKRWKENVKEDMGLAGLREEDAQNRTVWRKRIRELQPGDQAGNGGR